MELERKLAEANKVATTSSQRLRRLHRDLKHMREELSVARSKQGEVDHGNANEAHVTTSKYAPDLKAMPPAPEHFTQTSNETESFDRSSAVPQASSVHVAAHAMSLALGVVGQLGAAAGAAAVATTIAHVVARTGGPPTTDAQKMERRDSVAEGGAPNVKATMLSKNRIPVHMGLEPQMQQLMHQMDMEGSVDQAVQLAVKLRQLLRASVTVAVSMDMEDMLQAVALQVCKMVSCNRATIYEVDHVRQVLVSKGAVGVKSFEVPMHGSLSGTVARTGDTLHIYNAYDDPRFNKTTDSFTGYKTHNMLVMPCWRDGVIVAVMQVINKNGSEQFSDIDEVILGLLSTHIGVVVGHTVEKKQRIDRMNAQAMMLRLPAQLGRVVFNQPDTPADVEV